MSKHSVNSVILIAALLLSIILVTIVQKVSHTEIPEEKRDCLISAKHLKEIPGYIKVYEESDRDVALYIQANEVLSKIEINTPVVINNLNDCTIVNSGEGWFEVKVTNPESITVGMSGERVYYKDNPIGFISELTKNNTLMCYTLEIKG